jgi:hypothetical protein
MGSATRGGAPASAVGAGGGRAATGASPPVGTGSAVGALARGAASGEAQAARHREKTSGATLGAEGARVGTDGARWSTGATIAQPPLHGISNRAPDDSG